jgi:ATP-dependent DNA helicase 2 subunit 1
MIKKKKIGVVLALLRRNSSPVFCALLPQVSNFYQCDHVISLTYLQEEKEDETGWTEPAGFHLITLPFADDIRSAPIQEGFQGAFFPLVITQRSVKLDCFRTSVGRNERRCFCVDR